MSTTATSAHTGSKAAVEESCCGAEAKANPLGHHGAICHVEFTVSSLQKAKDFYGTLFQWEFHPFQAKEWYFMSPKGGPCGCVMEGAAPTDGKTVIYVNVDDIEATLTRATKLGGMIVSPKTEIHGGHGYFAKLRGPEGNILGLYNRG